MRKLTQISKRTMYRNINHLEVTDNETGYCALRKQINMTIKAIIFKKFEENAGKYKVWSFL